MSQDLRDIVVVSWNDKGFWQADLYRSASDLNGDEIAALPPDLFCTFKRSHTFDEALALTKVRWPNAEILTVEDEEIDE